MRNLICLFLFIGLTIPTLAQPTVTWSQEGLFIQEEILTDTPLLEGSFVPDFSGYYYQSSSSSVFDLPRKSPGIAMLSSAIVPGSGQAMNGKWGRAAVYFVADVVSLAYYVNQNNLAQRNEDAYENYGNQNWSVLAYAQWLVAYSEANNIDNGYQQLASQIPSDTPNWGNTTDDWRKVDLTILRQVERQTPFFFSNGNIGSTFSHEVQNYGSQQYYELMSKYYQFQPGWQDFHTSRLAEGVGHMYQYTWNRSMITANFIEGRDRAAEFNQNYRNAGNILMFLMVNHVISAFDAYFTVKLKNSKIQAQTNMLSYDQAISLSWHF